MTNFHIVTLFESFFDSPLRESLLGRAIQNKTISVDFRNPRDFSPDVHRRVDDKTYGGGMGMLMQVAPLAGALRSIERPGRILLMSPSGRQFDQEMARELAREEDITIVCGRYEGVDARLAELFPLEELSLCPAVLNGGETPALAIIEAVGRLAPGFMGKDASAEEESFSAGILEYPQYTMPEIFEGRKVPEILLTGHHARIAQWRGQQALLKTLLNRPELLDSAPLEAKDAEFLEKIPRSRPGRNLSFCLFHYPVYLEDGKTGVSSLTNLDIHDIARISRSYGMRDFFVLSPLAEQLDIMRSILKHWTQGPAAERKADRARALELARPVDNIDQLESLILEKYGQKPVYLAASAKWPKKGEAPLTPAQARALCENGPVVVCLGTARGLNLKQMDFCDRQLRPIRFLGDNHLSVRAAAAIVADRILGDYY